MLTFTTQGSSPEILRTAFDTLIVAGWTGRDTAAIEHHIEELAALGVPRPSSVPVFYRTSVNGLTQTGRLEVLGPATSGEVEPVLFGLPSGMWLGLGSDHTDRKAETTGIALSKQLCGKVVANTLWPLVEVAPHWNQLVIRSYATIAGERTLYQEGALAAIREPAELLSLYDKSKTLRPGAVMFCGTVGAIGGIRSASRFEMELEDPVRGRKLAHAYDIIDLPVIS
jgi:Protein of unknown function (DUF2848)